LKVPVEHGASYLYKPVEFVAADVVVGACVVEKGKTFFSLPFTDSATHRSAVQSLDSFA